ncbi:MAG TPA: S53 family peptidase [Bryobacteraceae bacterium]|nr:S53 family peptidase [Bryobacteraceae bacterium]
MRRSSLKKQIFGKIILIFAAFVAISASALASSSLPDQCIYALNRTAAGALSLQGSVDLNLSCGIVVDSKDPAAFLASGVGNVTARYIDVVGGYSGSGQISFSAAPQTGAPYRSDPLASLAAPSSSKCDYTNVNVSSGSTKLTPGTYCGGIAVSGNAQVTLSPGTYILMGGGLRASESSKLSGQANIVLTQGLGYSYGPLVVSDSALLNLQAPQTTDYPGILFWQDARLGTGLKPSVINGSTSSKLEGILYFPTSALTWSGSVAGAQGGYLAIIADTVSITGPATIASNYGSTLQRYLQLGATLMGLQGGTAVQSATPAARISGSMGSSGTFALAGNVHPRLAESMDQGEVSGSTVLPRIVMHLGMTQAQQRSLQQLVTAQQDRSSPYYHKWLAPEDIAARYGASQSDVSQISAWLQGMGFTTVQAARTRTFISMTGTAAQARYAFGTPIHRFISNGETHYANASDPVLPAQLQGVVASIRGLNDFHPHPHARAVARPRFTSSISGNHYVAPEDFQIIYNVKPLIAAGTNGTGQSIAVMGQTDIQNSDIEAFESASGLPVKDPQVVLDGPDPGTSSSDLQEADLDLEWSGAVAPGATIIYVNSSDVFTSLTYAIDNNLAPVASISYGACEAETGVAEINSIDALLLMANSEGMTVVAPAGDSGAADCDSGNAAARHGLAVDFPASSPYATSAGGTEFNEGSGTYWNTTNDSSNGSATGYIPEMVWNDSTTTAPISLSAGGGGTSSICGNYCGKPSWQTGAGVPNDGARDTPDIALGASPNHDGYLVCTGGSCVNGFRQANQDLTVVGGTSCSTPTFAAIVALIDQATGSRQGNVNTTLYSLASISTDAFHDITTGNNTVTCIGGSPNCSSTTLGVDGTFGYSAGTGYDQASGLGSVNAQNLVNEWNDDFLVTVNPTTLTLASGGSSVVTVNIQSVNGFSQTVTLSCTVPTTLAGVTCSIPSSVSGSGTASMTIAYTGSARFPFLPPGGGRLYFPLAGLLTASIGMLLVTRKRALLSGIGVLTFALLLAGCGTGNSSSSSSIPAGVSLQPTTVTGNVSVTATAGSVTRTATVAVTIP